MLPEVEAELQPAEMRLHRTLVRIVAHQGYRLPVVLPIPKPVQGALSEGCQLAIDGHPLPGIFDVTRFGHFALDEVELVGGWTGNGSSSHGSILRLFRRT